MRPRLIGILVLIILLPLLIILYLGGREQEEVVRQRFQDLLVRNLQSINDRVNTLMAERERTLLPLTELDGVDHTEIRARVRREPLIRQIFVVDAQGQLLHPTAAAGYNESESDFLQRFLREGGGEA